MPVNSPATSVNHDVNNVPVMPVYVPNPAGGVVAGTGVINAQGGTATQDGNNNYSAPLVVQLSSGTSATTTTSVSANGELSVGTTLPSIVQKANAASTGSVASLVATFTSPVTAGNTIVVLAGCGNGTVMTMADSQTNTYVQAVNGNNSTTFEAAIWFATNVKAGTTAVTATNGGSAASMALQIYEIKGVLAQVAAQPDQATSGIGTSATPSINAIAPSHPNELAFMAVAVGTAAQAASATAGTAWSLDSTQNTTTPAGLFTFGAFNQLLPSVNPVVPKCTIASSEPFAIAAASFRPVALAIEGSVYTAGYNYTHITTGTTTQVKIGAGILHTINVNTLVGSATIEYDDALSHTSPVIGIITLPGTITSAIPFSMEIDVAFATGLSVTTSGATDITVTWK